jgi:hypothetical protein
MSEDSKRPEKLPEGLERMEKGGYQPVNEGYQPNDKRGFSPTNSLGVPPVVPPLPATGGTATSQKPKDPK